MCLYRCTKSSIISQAFQTYISSADVWTVAELPERGDFSASSQTLNVIIPKLGYELLQGSKNIKQDRECSPVPSRPVEIKLIRRSITFPGQSSGRRQRLFLFLLLQPGLPPRLHHALSSPLSSTKSVWGMHYRWDTSSQLRLRKQRIWSNPYMKHVPFTTCLCTYTHLTTSLTSVTLTW